jgi:hypothetical protein
MLKSLFGHKFGLGHKNEVIVDDRKRLGARNAQCPVLSIAIKTLTTAQVLALNATPITVIAAPGAGFVTIVDHVLFSMDYAGVAYVAGAGEDLVLKYTNGSGAEVCKPVDGADFIDEAADVIAYSPGMIQTDDQGLVLTANAAVVAHMLTGEVITGTSDIVIHAYYYVIPILLSA